MPSHSYRYRTATIAAIRLDAGNLEEVEALCNGHIKGTKLPREERIIHFNARGEEHEIRMGDWLVCDRGNLYVYNSEHFNGLFEEATDSAPSALDFWAVPEETRKTARMLIRTLHCSDLEGICAAYNRYEVDGLVMPNGALMGLVCRLHAAIADKGPPPQNAVLVGVIISEVWRAIVTRR